MTDQTHNPALELRTLAELNQAQAAALIEVSERTWRRWETTGTMPMTKAKDFQTAVHNMDLGLIARPAEHTKDNPLGLPHATQTAMERLRELGANLRHPYTAADPFGQKRIEPLRQQLSVADETPQTSAPKSEVEVEALTSDDVKPEDLGKLVAEIRSRRESRGDV